MNEEKVSGVIHYLEEALITTSPSEENLIAFPTKLTNIYWKVEPNFREYVVVKSMNTLTLDERYFSVIVQRIKRGLYCRFVVINIMINR